MILLAYHNCCGTWLSGPMLDGFSADDNGMTHEHRFEDRYYIDEPRLSAMFADGGNGSSWVDVA